MLFFFLITNRFIANYNKHLKIPISTKKSFDCKGRYKNQYDTFIFVNILRLFLQKNIQKIMFLSNKITLQFKKKSFYSKKAFQICIIKKHIKELIFMFLYFYIKSYFLVLYFYIHYNIQNSTSFHLKFVEF